MVENDKSLDFHIHNFKFMYMYCIYCPCLTLLTFFMNYELILGFINYYVSFLCHLCTGMAWRVVTLFKIFSFLTIYLRNIHIKLHEESILIDVLSAEEETMNVKGEWTYIKLNKITMQTWRQMKIPFKFTSF